MDLLNIRFNFLSLNSKKLNLNIK
uniref:Uncharacterized protein n=1 Tax=Moumouvirus sp. 'Monve' TaxID=1128131 RepID=H2EEC8_9VIRU|nr:hypothetical protein mv_R546 [Moumouvirus Monve]